MRRVLLISVLDKNILLFRRQLIQTLLEQGATVHVLVPKGDCTQALRNLGVHVHLFPLTRGKVHPFALFRSVGSLRRHIGRIAPDLVHSFTHQANVLTALAMKGAHAHIPLVQTVSGLGATFIGTDVKSHVLRFMVGRVYTLRHTAPRAMVFQNPDDHELLVSQGLVRNATGLCIRGSGVDVERFRPNWLSLEERRQVLASLGVASGRVVVTMAARLLRDKGVPEFAEAARKVGRSHPYCAFLLVGAPDPGNPASLSQNELSELADVPGLFMPGWLDDMPRIWGASDLAVLPSHREGLPVSLQEALASGLPVVATDVPGCREAVEHGRTGLLVPKTDASALAAALDELVQDGSKRRVMGQAGREKAEQEFDGAHIARHYLELYERLLATE